MPPPSKTRQPAVNRLFSAACPPSCASVRVPACLRRPPDVRTKRLSVCQLAARALGFSGPGPRHLFPRPATLWQTGCFPPDRASCAPARSSVFTRGGGSHPRTALRSQSPAPPTVRPQPKRGEAGRGAKAPAQPPSTATNLHRISNPTQKPRLSAARAADPSPVPGLPSLSAVNRQSLRRNNATRRVCDSAG